MITIQNYYTETADLKQTDLPLTLWKGHQFVDKVTQNGNSWDAYHASASIKKTVDLFLDKLNEFMSKKGGSKVKSKRTKTTKRITTKDIVTDTRFKIKDGTEFIIDEIEPNGNNEPLVRAHYKGGEKGNYRDPISEMVSFLNDEGAVKINTRKTTSKTAKTTKPKSKQSTPNTKKKTAREIAYDKSHKVEKFSDELKMIKRFVLMHDKVKTQNQIRLFINALQKAIIERRIKKTSAYAKEIDKIQDYLIGLHGQFKNDTDILKIDIGESLRGKYLAIIGKQAELYSVKFIKSYINLQGKMTTNIKAKRLYNRIATAVNNGKVTKKDRYWDELESILGTLKSFVKKNLEAGMLVVSTKELNGLQGIVQGCGACKKNLKRFQNISQNTIMNSTDIVNLSFEKLGFTGKWKQLIGDPSRGFKAMIFGKPKMGKSYLAIEFGGYLARNHGKVLYVAQEEGIDDTLQQKLRDKNVAHKKFDVSNYLPSDLSNYDFVFLDSVNKLGLAPEDIEALDNQYPDTSFIGIFQTTKQGNFRGGNEFQHDVDVVIEVPEKGIAVQFGRFNQGGEINIFSNTNH